MGAARPAIAAKPCTPGGRPQNAPVPMALAIVLSLAFHWPTVATLAWVAGGGAGGLTFDIAVRVARLAAIAAHEGAHAVAAAAILSPRGQWPRVQRLGLAGHLLPGAYAPSMCVELPAAKSAGPAAEAVVRSAGVLASLLLLALVAAVGAPASVVAGVASAASGALLSDLPGGPLLGALPPLGCFCCGNWGLLAPREAVAGGRGGRGVLPRLCEQILSGVLEVVELRGAQAGGVCTFVGGRHGGVDALRSRTVKPKRGHLATNLFKDFRWEVLKRGVRSFLRSSAELPVVLLQGHSRFGTSSSPAVNETHPHQWLGSHQEVVWRYDVHRRRWKREETTVCVTVTHNGDFDAFELYGQGVPNGTLGLWLGRVLHHWNTAKGDSPKFAGLMDLLVCQGRWVASVRYAFLKVCMQHIDQASGWERLSPEAPNTAPSKEFYKEIASFFDAAFANEVERTPSWVPDYDAIDELADAVAEEINSSASSSALAVFDAFDVTVDLLGQFCRRAWKYFLDQDLLTSIHCFFKYAEGTFGVSATCTLWPNSIVLAAKGQPISLAFDTERPIAVWSSEPGSLMVRWPTAPASNPRRLATARWDLDDAAGEAVELRVFEGGTAISHIDAAEGGLPGGMADARYFAAPDMKLHVERRHHILIRGASLEYTPCPLTAEDFAGRWVRLRAPPFKTVKKGARGDGPSLDPVAADIQDIPAVLSDIDSSWSDRGSLNYKSGQKLTGCLRSLLHRPRDEGVIDVLIFGVENSLWVGQQFAADLKRTFPKLSVLAISSNWLLGMMQTAQGNIEPKNFAIAPQDFRLASGAIVLALSHSGTTYPTVWAARLVTRRFKGVIGFAMSSDFDTVLANSIGGETSVSNFAGTLFSTMAGVRPAEPATVATIAMHHTLTSLLVTCARGVAKKSGREWRLQRKRGGGDCELDIDEVMDLQRLAASLLPATEWLCGVTKYKKPFHNTAREDLLSIGAYISSHLTEGWYSIFWMCFYVYVSVTLHVPIFSLVWSLIVEHADLDLGDDVHQVIDYAVSHIDAHLYVFLAVLLALVHRLVCGRRLWTRFTARTLVVVDSTMNYKLLRAYGSKLGALAFPFTAFRVTGQNGEDHFVHEMTHLAMSDVILLVGRPDGRLGTLAASEGATIMSTQQAKYICSRPSRGIEAISVGHNPWVKDGLFRRAAALPTISRPLFLSQQLLRTECGGHAPGDVVAATAALMETTHEAADSKFEPFAWVTRAILWEELRRLNISVDAVSRDDALAVVTNIVRGHAEALQIDPDDFVASAVGGALTVRRPSARVGAAPLAPKASDKGGDGSISPKRKFMNAMKSSFSMSKSMLDAQGELSLSTILAVLRGKRMHNYIRSLQLGRQSMVMLQQIREHDTLIDRMKGARKCFNAWAKHTAERQVPDMSADDMQAITSKASSEALATDWRLLEEFRRRWRQHFMLLKSEGLEGAVFNAWREVLKENNIITPLKEYMIGTPPKAFFNSEAPAQSLAEVNAALPISGRLAGQAALGTEMLDGVRALERLYETRVGAVERLIAQYIILHRAVAPVARLRFLRYDLDRSESRLRVASTPAPVPFVEELPGNMEMDPAEFAVQNSITPVAVMVPGEYVLYEA